jgi:hypothetical protein
MFNAIVRRGRAAKAEFGVDVPHIQLTSLKFATPLLVLRQIGERRDPQLGGFTECQRSEAQMKQRPEFPSMPPKGLFLIMNSQRTVASDAIGYSPASHP